MADRALFRRYLAALTSVAAQGDAREESFYPALADLISSWAKATQVADVHVTAQPKPTEAGNPDFRVWDGREHIIGYIEAKAPTIENLEPIAGEGGSRGGGGQVFTFGVLGSILAHGSSATDRI